VFGHDVFKDTKAVQHLVNRVFGRGELLQEDGSAAENLSYAGAVSKRHDPGADPR